MEGDKCSVNENRRQSSVSAKENEKREPPPEPASPTPKVPKKFINNWKQACDRTKDRTKELLKKWRTLPEGAQAEATMEPEPSEKDSKWSERVWSTWEKRSPNGEELSEKPSPIQMTDIQKKKFEHFFISYLDLDRDDFISLTDFEAFAERIRHFSDWSKQSPDYYRLKEVQRGFIEAFLLPNDLDSPIYSYDELEKKIRKEQLSLHQWLEKWTAILNDSSNFFELPLWLQYFPKILFKAINTSVSAGRMFNNLGLNQTDSYRDFLSCPKIFSPRIIQSKNGEGTGTISKEEMTAFFSSVLGLSSLQLNSFADEAYKVLTSNGHQTLTYSVYRFCFANFIFGKYPNGPGLHVFGPIAGIENNIFFPIDYSALNSAPQDLERYSPQIQSNRRSVLV